MCGGGGGQALADEAEAADLTVAVGEAFEVAEDATYGTVTVNGALTVKAGVKLTASSLYVAQVADEDTPPTAPATVLVETGATVAVTGGVSAVIGDGGPATFTLEQGASLTSSGIALGRKTRTVAKDLGVYVRLVLNDATVTIDGGLYTNARSTDATHEVVRVELNGADARLSCRNFQAWGKKAQACLAFGGGCLEFNKWYNWGKSGSISLGWVDSEWQPQSLALESVDAQPIRIRIEGANAGNAFFENKTNGGSWFAFRGKGPLLIEKSTGKNRPLINNTSQDNKDCLRFENEGGVVVAPGVTLAFNAKSTYPFTSAATCPKKVRVAHGATLDLNGLDLALDGLEAAGVVTNSTVTNVTLTVGRYGGDVLFAAPPAADLPVAKAGAGALRIPDGTLANLTVADACPVEFLDRRDVGFPYYRLFIDDTKGSTFNLNEVAFLEGETDVTAEWTAISRIKRGGYYYGGPTGMVDRVDTTAWGDYSRNSASWGAHDSRTNRTFFVTHFGGAPSFDFEYYHQGYDKETNPTEWADSAKAEVWTNPSAPLVSASFCRSLTGYRLKTNGGTRLPYGWRLSGGFSDGITADVWQDLDVVRDAAYPGSLAWTPTYALAYTNAAVTVGSLSLADGVTWRLDVGQGRLALDALELKGGGTLVLRNFASLSDLRELPVEVGSCETAANLEKWEVVLEGKPNRHRRLLLRDGRLCSESTMGAAFIVR